MNTSCEYFRDTFKFPGNMLILNHVHQATPRTRPPRDFGRRWVSPPGMLVYPGKNGAAQTCPAPRQGGPDASGDADGRRDHGKNGGGTAFTRLDLSASRAVVVGVVRSCECNKRGNSVNCLSRKESVCAVCVNKNSTAGNYYESPQ